MPRALLAFLASLALAAPAAAQITRISVSTAGVQANGSSTATSISADGRYAAFASAATNLVAADANGVSDVFLRDRDTDADGTFDEAGAVATTRISLAFGVEANGPSTQPAISADGRYVVFVSTADNLVAGPNGAPQVYRVDRTNGAVVRISESAAGAAGDQASSEPAINATGDVIVFTSTATNLVSDGASPRPHVFLRQVTADRTARLSPLDPTHATSYLRPSVSATGTRVAYGVVPTSLSTPRRVYVADAATGAVLADVAAAAETPVATISASGGLVLVGPLRYVVDTRAVTPSLLALAAPVPSSIGTGSPSGRYLLGGGGTLNDFSLGLSSPLGLGSLAASFSADDRWLAVVSDAATLLPGGIDTNGVADAFVIDLPARFDLDSDTMDDRWETLFGVTSASADPDVDGVTNAAEENAGTHPNGVQRRFFAEGATGGFFATRLWIANPDAVNAARVVLNVDSGQGVRRTLPVALVAGGSAMVDIGSIAGFEASDVSTIIESDRLVVVDRAMEWGIDPVPNGHGYGSHAETAAAAASTQWFLTEGSTVLGFELYYLLQNPQPTLNRVTVRYLLSSGTVITRIYNMAPRSRTTIYLNVIPGIEEIDVSGDISADAPIIAERAMYRTTPGQYLRPRHGVDGRQRPGDALVPRRGRHGQLLRSLRPHGQPRRFRRDGPGRLRQGGRHRGDPEPLRGRAQSFQRLRRQHSRPRAHVGGHHPDIERADRRRARHVLAERLLQLLRRPHLRRHHQDRAAMGHRAAPTAMPRPIRSSSSPTRRIDRGRPWCRS